MRVLNLTVSNTIVNTQQVEICPGNSYEGYTGSGIYQDTFVSAFGCDSVRILDLAVVMPEKYIDTSVCYGVGFEHYFASGIYEDTLQGVLNSCDTLRHLTLTVWPPLLTNIINTICEGQNFLGYSTTGIFMDTFQNAAGCDSVRILDLTVTDAFITQKDIEICMGDIYEGHASSGSYTDTLQSQAGCDSIILLQLLVIPNEIYLDVEICSGGRFENYSMPGMYEDTIQGVASPCDTLRHLTLFVLPAEQTTEVMTICAGDHYQGYQ